MAGYDYDGSYEVVALCPTRENAKGALEMVESFYDTIHRINSDVVLVVDEDDPQMEAYQDIPRILRERKVGVGVNRQDRVTVMVVEGGTLTKATNEAVARMWDSDAIVGHVGDDHRFRTPGWDTVIRDTILGGAAVCYAYDGFRSAWASAWWTPMVVIRTLGWLAVPGSMHLTIDDVFMDIGAGLGRLVFLPDVLIEHLHPAGGKVPWRDIVQSHYRKDRRVKEEENLIRYRNEDFANDITKLRDALGLPHEPIVDLAPGVTFRASMRGEWAPALSTATFVVDPGPTLEMIAETLGHWPRNTAEQVRGRREWKRRWRIEHPGWDARG